MHASILTLLLATGVGQTCCDEAPAGAVLEGCNTVQGCATVVPGQAACAPGPCHPHGDFWQGCLSLCLGPMPQTCYGPRFGAYPGNSRHIHRYPAFHGTYYRQPYNYRQLFDYPWQAGPYDPRDYFTHQMGGP